MAGQIGLKLGEVVEGMCENVLAKEYFGSVKVDRGQFGGPQVPLLGRGDDKETPNQIGHVGTIGHEKANYEPGQGLQADQGDVGGPQVSLLGHGNEIKTPNWAWRD